MIPAVEPQQQNRIPAKKGFYTTPELIKELKESHDHVVPSNPIYSTKIAMDKFQNAVTTYPSKGLTGSINANFYEFLTMGVVPYLVGSGMMMAVFNSASKYFEPFQSAKASALGRKMSMGVLFYGIMKNLSKSFIEKPVAMKTGLDVNMRYRTTKSELPEYKDAEPRKSFEYHKVFESVDFPRWDLLYDMEEGKPRNYYYDKVANKMGLGKKLSNSDQEVKPKAKETIIKTKVWSTLSSYLWAGLGVAVAVQDKWDEVFKDGMGLGKIFSKESLKNPQELLKHSKDFMKKFKEGFRGSVKQLWEGGAYKSPVKAAAGKAFVGAAVASTVLGAALSMFDFFGKRKDVIKGKIDYDKDYTVG